MGTDLIHDVVGGVGAQDRHVHIKVLVTHGLEGVTDWLQSVLLHAIRRHLH